MQMRRSVFLVILILALVGPRASAGEAARQTPVVPPQEAATFNIGVPAGDAYHPLSAVVEGTGVVLNELNFLAKSKMGR